MHGYSAGYSGLLLRASEDVSCVNPTAAFSCGIARGNAPVTGCWFTTWGGQLQGGSQSGMCLQQCQASQQSRLCCNILTECTLATEITWSREKILSAVLDQPNQYNKRLVHSAGNHLRMNPNLLQSYPPSEDALRLTGLAACTCSETVCHSLSARLPLHIAAYTCALQFRLHML